MYLFNSKKVKTMVKKTPKNIIFYKHYLLIAQTTTNSCYNKLEVFCNYSQTLILKISFL